MFNAIQPKTPGAVMAGLQQHGASVGAKKMLQWEFRHAKDAITSGTYITLYNDYKKYECSRIGKFSRCFCNHGFAKHKLKILKGGRFGKNPCGEEGCKCENFLFMFRRPEEIGQNFLVRRKGFDVTQWRPLCRCKHPHAVHDPVRTKCKECACAKFVSNFACLSCDGKWEEHVTLYEDEELRRELGKAVGEAHYPLADCPDIQAEYIRQLEEEKVENSNNNNNQVAAIETGLSQVSLGNEVATLGDSGDNIVATREQRMAKTLPAREQPERSVRLMKEKGMLRKYN